MSRRLLPIPSLLAVPLLLALATPAVAQEGSILELQDETETSETTKETASTPELADTPHKSDAGYSITAPKGWAIVSGDLSDEELARLPERIRDSYNPERTDVMFMKLDADGFKDNINVVVLDQTLTFDPETRASLKSSLKAQYSRLFDDFTFQRFEPATYADRPAVRLEATYTLNEHSLYLYQGLLAGSSSSLVLTCTFAQSRKPSRLDLCTEVFNSVSFDKKKEPEKKEAQEPKKKTESEKK